jgi:hypothetical protein
MRGDFSRRPFRRNLHDAGLLHQQGRVWLDGDWNEHLFHRLDLNEQEAFDVIGPCGIPDNPTTPDDDDFYLIELDPALGAGDFRIHAGRAYVDGILSVLDEDTTYLAQPDLLDPPPIGLGAAGGEFNRDFIGIVYLEVWRRLITYLEDDTVREKALEGPDTVGRLKTLGQIKVVSLPTVRGQKITCENAHNFLPKPGSGTLSTDQPEDLDPEDPCRLPDESLFTGRENLLYRIEIHDSGDVAGIARPGDAIAFETALSADVAVGATSVKVATALTKAQSAALLKTGVASIVDDDGNTETLLVTGVTASTLTLGKPLTGKYVVAKHPKVVGGIARFKWSRNNASFGVRVTAVDASRKVLTVASLGRDQVTALRAGDLVEIADDASELGPNRGHLTYLTADPNPDLFTVQLAEAIPASFDVAKLNERHLLLRRWDGVSWAGDDFDDPDMDLGDGVRIKFEGFDLHPGDWWNIKTRRVDGSVEQRVEAPPDGIERHRCVLAVVNFAARRTITREETNELAMKAKFSRTALAKFNSALPDNQTEFTRDQVDAAAANSGAQPASLELLKALLDEFFGRRGALASDCRPRFPPLTELPEGQGGHGLYLVLKLLGGDGQEAAPAEVLPCPLVVGVEEEHGRPAPDVVVRFEVITQGAVGSSPAGPFGAFVDIPAGAAGTADVGVARAFLRLGDDEGCHIIRARILEPTPPQGDALEVFFQSHIRRRVEVPPKPEFPRVIDMDWRNDDSIKLDQFNNGLAVRFSTAMMEETASLDTFVVVVEIPEILLGQEGRPRWLGHRPFIVYGGIRADGDVWIFRPCPAIPRDLLGEWLEQETRIMIETRECIQGFTGRDVDVENPRIRVRVTLKGNVILSKEEQLPLDGNVFGAIEVGAAAPITDLDLPSGDDIRGGDFESWFYLDKAS